MSAPDLVVDARGLRCPMPVLELARRVADLPGGSLVALLSDDPAAAADVPAWCALRGHTFVGVGAAPEDGGTAYLVRLPADQGRPDGASNPGGAGSPSATPSSSR